jgi:hypothetical protein
MAKPNKAAHSNLEGRRFSSPDQEDWDKSGKLNKFTYAFEGERHTNHPGLFYLEACPESLFIRILFEK